MRRVLSVARIQLVNAPITVGMPWLVLGLAFLVNLVIFGAIDDIAPPEGRTTGALMSVYIVAMIGQLQTMTQVFPFALGLSVTRRTFFAATSLLVVAQAVVFGTTLYLLMLLERATGGWGLSLRFFGPPPLVQDNPVLQLLVYMVPFLFLSFLGMAIGLVFKRWGQIGIYVAGIGTALPLAAAAFLVTRYDWWPAIGRFFVDQPSVNLLAGYPLILAALVAVGGYLLIRRATA